MDKENLNATQSGNTEPLQADNGSSEKSEKTFTQSDVDRIVEKRLKRELSKQGDIEALKEKAKKFDEIQEANKSELEKANEKIAAYESEINKMKKDAEIRGIREAVAKEKGVPANLLTGVDETSCESQADAILEFAGAQKPAQSTIPDGGDPNHKTSGGKGQLFKEWFEQYMNS